MLSKPSIQIGQGKRFLPDQQGNFMKQASHISYENVKQLNWAFMYDLKDLDDAKYCVQQLNSVASGMNVKLVNP